MSKLTLTYLFANANLQLHVVDDGFSEILYFTGMKPLNVFKSLLYKLTGKRHVVMYFPIV